MINYSVEIFVSIILMLFIITTVAIYFFIKSRYRREKSRVSNKLHIDYSNTTEPVIDNDWILKDNTEEIIECNLQDNFKIEKNIVIVHSDITI